MKFCLFEHMDDWVFLLGSSLKAGFRFSKPVTVMGSMPTILPITTGHPSASHHRPVCFSRLWRNGRRAFDLARLSILCRSIIRSA